ncbi:uncharacterized protein LOC109603610 isoform X2 [Aethina tumida]|uniref:uncharacterized protein LOC109603610 isoform X2 n=1 Tax=Aethina tumida TaxID=116153 RepID=UPI002148E3BB|nr:uncharacterized protein LOC109603610 isoform X2 [Aethina tumida]
MDSSNSQVAIRQENRISTTGYHASPKRQKLSTEDNNELQSNMMKLPTEMIVKLCGYFTNQDLSNTMRLVNHRLGDICTDLLNTRFKSIGKSLNSIIRKLTTALKKMDTNQGRSIRNGCKLLNIAEFLSQIHSMTMNSVRRYIYNELYDTSSGCMYAGLLLDKYKIIIDNLSKVPSKLHPYIHFTDYVEPAQVVEILRLTKMFLSHFEKYNEGSMPNIFSGCKIIDILDSAKFCKRVIAYEKSTKDTFVAKYCYYFENSWFIGLPMVGRKNASFAFKKQKWYLRLRRLVWSHCQILQEYMQHERELSLIPDGPFTPPEPQNMGFTGFGRVGETYFYYGIVNRRRYALNYLIQEDSDDSDDDDASDDDYENDYDFGNDIDDDNVEDNNNDDNVDQDNVDDSDTDSAEDSNEEEPNVVDVEDIENLVNEQTINNRSELVSLGVMIEVSVKCPPLYSPYKYIKQLNPEYIRELQERDTRRQVEVKVNVNYPGAFKYQLPMQHSFKFNSNDPHF